MEKVKVKVAVAHRDGFSGYWAVQQFFPEGVGVYEVPAEKLEELKAQKYLSVLSVGDDEVKALVPVAVAAPVEPAVPAPGDPGSPAKKLELKAKGDDEKSKK